MTAQPSIPGLFSDEGWQESARKVVLRLPLGWEFSADNVHKLGLPEPPHVNHYGILFKVMAEHGDLVHVRYVRSQRPERHGGLIRLWRRCERRAA